MLAALYGTRLVAQPVSLIRSLTKTGAVVALALAAVWAEVPAFLVLALLLCAVGDWFLSRDGDAAFVAGVGAFAAGHLAYIALFLTLSHGGVELLPLIRFVLAWLFLILGLVMAVLLWPRAGRLRWPVMGYIVVILGMGWAALWAPMQGAQGLIVLGALSFMASDMVLALDRFVLPKGHPARTWAPYVIWGAYWPAQAMFTLALIL